MLPSNAIEAEASSLPPRYDKEFVADYSSRFAETEVAARYQEDEVKTSYRRPVYQEDSNKKTVVKTGSKFPNDRRSFSKGSSLQSLVRRRSRRHAQSSLPLDADLSAYSLYPEQKPEETCTCTSTLVYASRGENKDVSSSMNVATTGTGNNVTCSVSGSRINTGSSTRTASVITAAGPSTSSSWNNSPEEELDYVVDPVQGNAYYKGQLLGKGGFAKVFLMTDVTNGNEYACKIIRKNRMQKIHMQKIAREIIIHKELNHVNVVQLHHYFEDNLNVYMLMEACPRKSLMHVLKYRGKVTEPEARYYMKQMVTGVAYIHSQRVVHRDLKPGNMFLSEQMIVKIGDFGLATRLDGQCRRVTICGTPNYIAPEVLYKQAYSYEADVWALGCILYALLVGQPPFDTATLKETYARICSNHYREVDGTMASRNGQDLIRWLLQPNPELRPSLEKVKEHPYLTEEYVPESLPRISCFQVPHTTLIENQGSSPSFDSSASANQKLNNVQVHTLQRTQQQDQHRGNISEKTLRKGSSKVISWLARKLRKVPKFRQRLSSVLCPDQKKTGYAVQSMQMHRALENCINGIKCKNKLRNHPPVKDLVPLFITKWIDYSNKYGLGFQLSDRSVGILFNDHTKISYTRDRKRVEYVTTEDEVTRFQKEEDVPTALQKKLLLLQRFTQYMDKFMTEGGEIKRHRVPTRNSRNSCVPRMRRWFRTDKTIVMELTVPLLQVNFFEDHTKLVLSQESPNKGYLVTYIDTSRRTSSYWLNDIRDLGCTADLYERLYHVYQVSREFAEVHDNTIG